MRVAVEAISVGGGLGASAGGMIVYYRGLLTALAELESVDEVIALVPPWDVGLDLGAHPKLRQISCNGLPRNRLLRVAYEQTVLPLLVKRHAADALISTCNTRPLLWRGASAVVVQSLQYMLYPKMFSPLRRRYLHTLVPASLRSADAVIAVSEWERQELIRLFRLRPERVFTVYHGMSDLIQPDGHGAVLPFRLEGGEPYILMVSALYAFKNHRRLIQAFARLVQRQALPHALVIAGGDVDVTRAELAAVAAAAGVANRVHLLGGVPHQQVLSLLKGADAIAYTSLYETFGQPILEALSLGLPLVTSNLGAMVEVAGPAARLVDPFDIEDMAAGLADAVTNDDLRRRLAVMGPLRAAAFRWDLCAEGTIAALVAAAGGRHQRVRHGGRGVHRTDRAAEAERGGNAR